ncbi:HNH endonuclease [Streptomyces sp. AcH 505]|uniref:HNH endonuclease n=1 Tax=Streptomyces sp. AcH 505 TaxID=352211 RepID=UPI0018E2969E
MTKSPSERFFAKVDKPKNAGACWLWTGARIKGYGQFYPGPQAPSRLVSAHRWSYEHHVGRIPEGLQLDHRCHSIDRTCVGGVACAHRACVNPQHLEPVNTRTNIGRIVPMAAARRGLHQSNKDRCPAGHPYTSENTYVRIRPGGGINRVCRACKRQRWTDHAAANPRPPREPRRGFVPASRKASGEEIEKARDMMTRGISLREAARQIGLSHTQLRRRLDPRPS